MAEDNKPKVKVLGVLDKEQFKRLQDQVGIVPFIRSGTSDLEAGQMVGVQRVYDALRNGFLIDS